MISLKRLEAMRRWQRDGGVAGRDIDGHVGWALRAGLLRLWSVGDPLSLAPTWALAPAIAKAEAEHARHRTEQMRGVHRRRAFDASMELDSGTVTGDNEDRKGR